MKLKNKILTALLVMAAFFSGSARQLKAMADGAKGQTTMRGHGGSGGTCVGEGAPK